MSQALLHPPHFVASSYLDALYHAQAGDRNKYTVASYRSINVSMCLIPSQLSGHSWQLLCLVQIGGQSSKKLSFLRELSNFKKKSTDSKLDEVDTDVDVATFSVRTSTISNVDPDCTANLSRVRMPG